MQETGWLATLCWFLAMRGVLADDSRSEGGQAGGGGKNSAQLGRLELPWWGVLVRPWWGLQVLVSPATDSWPEAELELVRWVELSTSASD